jgi:pimeloyl-ACP methyl ester carboxylesterase
LKDVGSGEPIVLLHGLFGSLSNWVKVVEFFKTTHRVIVPRLPLYTTPLSAERLIALVEYLEEFVAEFEFEKVTLMGNSLGGHLALLYAWRQPWRVRKLVLAGSSGLFERSFGGTFPQIRNYNYIRERVEETFYVKDSITKELVDEVFATLQNPQYTRSIIGLARAAQRQNVATILESITCPTLLVWGLQDSVTPPETALQFHDLLPNSKVVFLDNCGHVPMMEQPEAFNLNVRKFLMDQH